MAMMAVLGGVMSAVGAASSASGTIAAGKAEKQAADYKAVQEEQQAMESRAIGQRQAFDERHKADVLNSTLTARAAADGGSATDPTAVTLGENIEGQGAYNALGQMFKGEDRARGLEDQATSDRATGQARLDGARAQATGTLFGSVAGLASKFG